MPKADSGSAGRGYRNRLAPRVAFGPGRPHSREGDEVRSHLRSPVSIMKCGFYNAKGLVHAQRKEVIRMTRGAEDKLIERIKRRIPSSGDGVLRFPGIGDDAAVLRPVAGTEWALTCDQFIEDVHFLIDVHSRR